MILVPRALADPRTYRRLLYLLSAVALAPLWFALLLSGWLAVVLLAVTPLLVPALIGFRMLTWLAAQFEALLARELLGAEVRVARPRPGPKGYVGRIRVALADARFWEQQAFLGLRLLLGGAIAIGLVSAFASALAAISLPVTYRFGGGPNFGSWQVDTFGRALLFVPAGILALLVSAALVRPCAALWSALARLLLDAGGEREPAAPAGRGRALRRLTLAYHAVSFAAVNLLLAVVWALTGRGYFWPEWTLLALGLPLALHAWVTTVYDDPNARRLGRGLALPVELGCAASLAAFFVGVWAVTGHAYFWPVWPILVFVVLLGVHGAALFAPFRSRARLAERIDVLTTTRAGAVDAAEDELRRIERDLHDGAQARLVALGMSLGLAEQKLASDPEAARALLLEARAGAGTALKELRDLARGIYPPILTDRGLEAALGALAADSALPVEVSGAVGSRPAAAVETAAYFVGAEGLANAAKHAGATRVEIRLARREGELVVAVVDDGHGGADPGGSGLSGIRHRVEALDGTLSVSSPPGGPTIVEAVLPCGS